MRRYAEPTVNLPSLGDVATTAQRTARRFPLVLAAGVLAAYAGVSLIEGGSEPALTRILATAALGLPLLFALTLAAERHASDHRAEWLIPGVGVAILIGFWFAWPQWTTSVRGLRYVQLSAAFHLLAAFAPFVRFREPNAFWQYNRILFIRFLTAALYTGVLWIGLSGALLALDKLFGVDVPAEGYVRLWIVLGFVFNPWFFVAGVPEYLGALEDRTDYPTGLRVFTQYVLVPIVAIYLVILTIYLGKVVITREWPSGWIGYLVSSVAGAGIFSWLLVHPLEERKEYAWVKTFTRGFYVALAPAIVMLWFAIWKRVDQYGITEPRYFLGVLSVWLGAIAVYYTVSRSRSIKIIPATLCILGVVTFAGPWSAYSVSRASQTKRLEATLERNGLLVDGTLRRSTSEPSDTTDSREISAGFRYLLEVHGAHAVTPWLGELAPAVGAIGSGTTARADAGARSIVAALNIRYVERYARAASENFTYLANRRNNDVVSIEGYAYAVRFSGLLSDSLQVSDDTYLSMTFEPLALIVTQSGILVLDVSLQPMLDSAAAYRRRRPTGDIPADVMTLEVRQGSAGALVRLSQVSGTGVQSPKLTSVSGDVFFRVP